MPLLDPDAPDSSYHLFNENSAAFLRGIRQHYSRDVATQAIEALKPILGTDWFGRVIFGIVSDDVGLAKRISIVGDTCQIVKKIQAIKAMRGLTGMGLTDAKNFVESCDVMRIFEIQDKPPAYDPRDWKRLMESYMDELHDAGFTLEAA